MGGGGREGEAEGQERRKRPYEEDPTCIVGGGDGNDKGGCGEDGCRDRGGQLSGAEVVERHTVWRRGGRRRGRQHGGEWEGRARAGARI